MQISSLLDRGKSNLEEDASFIGRKFVGVLDGVSETHKYRDGPKNIGGKSGGQCVVDIIKTTFESANGSMSLEQLALEANERIKEFAMANSLPLDEGDKLPGAAAILVHLGEKHVDIIQASDALGVYQMCDGSVRVIANPKLAYEIEIVKAQRELLAKNGGDIALMWDEHFFMQVGMRIRFVNSPSAPAGFNFSLFNGQHQLARCWRQIQIKRKLLARLIIFTDSFVGFDISRSEDTLGENLISRYQSGGKNKGGLEKILKWTRSLGEHGEATAIAIEF
tara:strand:+ start:1088 stop:1924 length:837 start_codon:yes stop_codon:yes gene_type:complete